MTKLTATKIEVIVPQEDAKDIVGLIADKAIELHVTQVTPNLGNSPRRRQKPDVSGLRAGRSVSSQEALAQCKSQPSIRILLDMAKNQATFTQEQAGTVAIANGKAKTGVTSSISRMVKAGLVKKIQSRPSKWEFDRATLQKEGLL